MKTKNSIALVLVGSGIALGCRVDPPMPSRLSTMGQTGGGYAMADAGVPVCQLTEAQVSQYTSSDQGPDRFLNETSGRVVFLGPSRKLLTCSGPQLTLMDAPAGSKDSGGSADQDQALATLIRCPVTLPYSYCYAGQGSSQNKRWTCFGGSEKPVELSELPSCNQSSSEPTKP